MTREEVELAPGNEDTTDLGNGMDPAEVVDSAGEEERGVDGPEVLGLR